MLAPLELLDRLAALVPPHDSSVIRSPRGVEKKNGTYTEAS